MQNLDIIPKVKKIDYRELSFVLDENTTLKYVDEFTVQAELLRGYLFLPTGFTFDSKTEDGGVIELIKDENIITDGYILDIEEQLIRIIASNNTGIVSGIQSLRQLIGPEIFSNSSVGRDMWSIKCCYIEDEPRFKWRGMHLDVSRHFIPKEDVKKFIDQISLYKYNSLHLHLTDDQGWRIEIKKYPKLTEVGSTREATLVGHLHKKPKRYDDNPHSGYYTQDDIREIVDFASVRGVTIVPEIDLPGHMQAAIAAYPELGCTDMTLKPLCHWGICQHILNVNDSTINFLKDVIDEVIDLFPGRYIHIGGDEALKYEWMEQRHIQDRMLELGIDDEEKLQSWFMLQISNHITSKGRRVIGWDEIIDGGLIDDITIMSWRDEKGGIKAASEGYDVIMVPQSHTYFDHYQGDPHTEPLAIGGDTTLEKVYNFEPVYKDIPDDLQKHIIGSQGQLWTEYMKDMKQVEYMAFPRLCALSEVLWCDKSVKEYSNFLTRMDNHKDILKNLGVNFRDF